MTKTNARNTQGKTQTFQGEAATCKTGQPKSSDGMQEVVCVDPHPAHCGVSELVVLSGTNQLSLSLLFQLLNAL